MEWNVLGHEWAASLLSQHIARGEVRHAYLFTGPSGVGRRTLAVRFAQALNCLQPPAPGQPCGTCRTCMQIEKMQHPDFFVVQAEDVGETLKVDQIREIQHSLSLAPYEARYRVAVLLRFEEANESAQNALLKTLEEAPEKAILLLTADSAENLLPTIVSRCEILRLRSLPLGLSEKALVEQWHLTQSEAHSLTHLSGGCIGRAVYYHEHPEDLEKYHEWVQDLLQLLEAPLRDRMAYADSFRKKERTEIRKIFQVWLSFWRDVMLAAAGADVPITNFDFQNQVQAVADQVGLKSARICTSDLEQGLFRLDQNLNKQLLTEVLLLDWPRPGTFDD